VVKFVAPAGAYKKQLAKGENVWKGEFNSFKDDNATFEFFIWKDGDGNCCPSAGRVTGSYGLTGERHYDAETKQWSAQFRISPASFKRESYAHTK